MMKPLQKNDLPPDILTGEFKFSYEYMLVDAAPPESYDENRCRMLRHLERGTINVEYERIGPEPDNADLQEILKVIEGIKSSLDEALQVTA